ncbi:hypothetical protein C8R45DRAFT_914815 [Mycena sanguinolenta]|nr:hypothetical protein C8R45DRAFT_914815 [Mycena sanguinolenta]
MAAASFSMHTILAQQTESTRESSPTQIKQLIAESDCRAASLQTEIAILESQIAVLVELRDRECAAGDALRFLAAPIRTLPVELLADIFVLTIRDDANEFYALHVRDALRISHVCSHWRQIANGTPQLWTGPITVDFNSGDENYLNGLRAWFARSEPLSVPISIIGPQDKSWLTDFGSRLIEELLHVASRWRSLRFIHRTPASLVQCLAASGRLDYLETLLLQSVVSDGSDFDPTTILSFATAPRLRKLTTSYNRIPMPWAYAVPFVK